MTTTQKVVLAVKDSKGIRVFTTDSFFELAGLAIHNLFDHPLVEEPFCVQYFTISHKKSGYSLVRVIDGLDDAIECCKFIVQEVSKLGVNWDDISSFEECLQHPQRKEISQIVNRAVCLFVPEWAQKSNGA